MYPLTLARAIRAHIGALGTYLENTIRTTFADS